MCFIIFFFFSSRRRHTRFDCDWSSDVCSSDLKLAPHILQPVMRAVEAVNVQVNHLQEAAREKLRVEELSPASDQLVLYALVAVERLQFDALREFGAAEIIFVAGGSCPELLIRPEILDVGLDQRRVLAKQTDFRPPLPHKLFGHPFGG